LEEVFDPTGAGDSFAGGFLGQLARSGELTQQGIRRAIVYGSVVASFTVEDFGVKRLSSVTLRDIEERYKGFVQLTDFHT
jgi:sugar/nucleoside kinase (ribokinase family)